MALFIKVPDITTGKPIKKKNSFQNTTDLGKKILGSR